MAIAYVDVDLDEAKLLADLSGATLDLESARDLAKFLAGRLSAGAFDMAITDAFTTTILVRYARPFMKGRRERLGPDILRQLAPKETDLHEKFIAWRNKHIAHSVNSFEENQVVAHYNTETVMQTGVQSISVQQTRLVGLSLQDLTDIQTLVETFLVAVRTRIEGEKARVLDIVRRKAIEDVLSTGVKPRGSVALDSVNRVRGRG